MSRTGETNLPRTPYTRLTLTQHALLRQIAAGFSNKVIAERLDKSANTVRNQLHTLFRMTGARTREEIGRWYLRCVGDAPPAPPLAVKEPAGVWAFIDTEHRVTVTRNRTFEDSEY